MVLKVKVTVSSLFTHMLSIKKTGTVLTEDHHLLNVCEMSKFIDNKNEGTSKHKTESTGVIKELCLWHIDLCMQLKEG